MKQFGTAGLQVAATTKEETKAGGWKDGEGPAGAWKVVEAGG